MFADVSHVVGHQNHLGAAAFFLQHLLGFCTKVCIPGSHDFINQQIVKVESHAEPKGDSRAHSRRVGFYGLIKIVADFGEVLHETYLFSQRIAFCTVNPADETHVVTRAERTLKTSGESNWPGYAFIRMNTATIGRVDAADQPH